MKNSSNVVVVWTVAALIVVVGIVTSVDMALTAKNAIEKAYAMGFCITLSVVPIMLATAIESIARTGR